jgi:hypothetical protein
MKGRRLHIKLAVVLAVLFGAVVMKPLWQRAWIYMSGAVIPSHASALSSTQHDSLVLSIGGERWVSKRRLEEASAYHALVIPPRVELRRDGSVSKSDGVSHTETLKWLCPRSLAGDNQAEEIKSLTLTYHAVTQKVTIGSDTYSLAEGNLFVVRLDDGWRPHVTQLGTMLSKAVEIHEVLESFKRALPDDEAVRKL